MSASRPAWPCIKCLEIENFNMNSTLRLFRQLYENLPPFFPEETAKAMGICLEQLENNSVVSLEVIENEMIKFGYEIWPYNQAWQEFYDEAFAKKGEEFLLAGLSPEMRGRYRDFKIYGGSLKALFTGSLAQFFKTEERAELCSVLVETQKLVSKFVRQDIIALRQKAYFKKVEEFTKILVGMKKEINDLYKLAYKETDHPILVQEIKEKIRAFEHGLCLLGPAIEPAAVCNISDFYRERKIHLRDLHNIHLTAAIGWVGELK